MSFRIRKILKYYGLEVDEQGRILCPFHSESRPSMCIDLDEGMFHCFGCGAKGDIIDLVAQIDRVNKLEALRKIAKIANGEKTLRALVRNKPKRNRMQEAYERFKKLDKPDWNFSNYLVNKRKLSPVLLKMFDVRLNLKSIYKFVIPLKENGKFKGYIARGEGNKAERKYVYNWGFRRRSTLVGNYKNGIIFVVEGILDYLKAIQFGVTNVVCLLGWKASNEQIRKLKMKTNILISALDNDERGDEGNEYLKNFFRIIRFRYPKDIKDICAMKRSIFEKIYKEAIYEAEKEKEKLSFEKKKK